MSGDSTELPTSVCRVTWYLRLRMVLPLLLFAFLLFLLTGSMLDAEVPILVATCPLCAGSLALVALVVLVPAKQASALRYWMEGSTLRIDEGILIRRRKSIPLDRITDIALVQGPFLRLCGIWALQIQTAGSAQQAPEGTLWGLVDAESTRDAIMRARDSAAGVDGRRHDH